MRRGLIHFFSAALVFLSFTASLEAEESWSAYTNPDFINKVLYADGSIWCATGGGIIQVDPDDGTARKYTTLEGLPANICSRMAANDDGTIWFNMGGLVRYKDGKWDVFKGEHCNEIAVDRFGNLWATASRDTILFFDGAVWKQHIIDYGEYSVHFRNIAVDSSGVCWAAINEGLVRIENGAYEVIPEYKSVSLGQLSILSPDRKGNIWTVVREGIARISGDSLEVVLPGRGANDITFDDNNTMWILGNNGLFSFDGVTLTAHDITEDGELYMPQSLAVDDDGKVWFHWYYIYKTGLRCYNGSSVKAYHYGNDIPYNDIRAVVVDHDGAVWAGAMYAYFLCGKCPIYGGAARYDGISWTRFTDEDGMASNRVRAMTVDPSGAVWTAHDSNGLSRYKDGAWEKFCQPVYTDTGWLGPNTIYALAFDSKGTGWFACNEDSVLSWDGENWSTYTVDDGLVSNNIKAIAVDSSDRVWFGSAKGISIYDGTTFTTIPIPDHLATWGGVTCIAFDANGVAWCGFEGYFLDAGGLARYDGGLWQEFTPADGLASCHVFSLAVDNRNVLWIGTNKGLNRYDGESWRTWTVADGLLWNDVLSIALDKKGTIWLGTNSGLSRFDPDKDVFVETGDIFAPAAIEFDIAPNPFNGTASITVTTMTPGNMRIDIFNVAGQNVSTLFNGPATAGKHVFRWNGTDSRGNAAASGVYLVTVRHGLSRAAKKMTMVR